MLVADVDKTTDTERARLLWQCRRGMLELDAMLQAFMDKAYDDLNESQQHAFEVLLQTPDQLLLEYLMGRTIPIDKEVAYVARRIRESAGP
jgi:antitoxin CptB